MAAMLTYLARMRPRSLMLVLPRQDLALGTQMAAALLGVPQVVAFQLACTVLPQPSAKRKLYAWIRKRASWIAVSQQNGRAIAEGFGCHESEIRVIYNGANVGERRPPGSEDRGPLSVRANSPVRWSARTSEGT